MRKDNKPVHSQAGPDNGERHVYGPRLLGQLIPSVTRPAFKKRSPAAAQIMADWREIVGPVLAATAAPRRLSGTTLTLACAGPAAMELQHLSEQLAARINGHLGRVAVTRFRFVQDGVPAPPAPPPPPPHPGQPAAVPLPGVAPGALYDALQALGRAVRRP